MDKETLALGLTQILLQGKNDLSLNEVFTKYTEVLNSLDGQPTETSMPYIGMMTGV